jgi:hypothetical protein
VNSIKDLTARETGRESAEDISPTPFKKQSDALYEGVNISDALYKEIIGRNTKYTPQQRIGACAQYMVTGSSRAVERLNGIPASTVRAWMLDPWWKELSREVRKAKQDELDAKLTGIIMKATVQLEDRVDNGNDVLDKNGELRKVPMNSSQLAKDAIGIIYDKRALVRNQATSIVEHKDDKTILRDLATQFVKIMKENEPSLIEGEVVVDP